MNGWDFIGIGLTLVLLAVVLYSLRDMGKKAEHERWIDRERMARNLPLDRDRALVARKRRPKQRIEPGKIQINRPAPDSPPKDS